MKDIKNIFFVRHGQSQDNVDGVFSRDDTPLSEHGKEQAASIQRQCSPIDVDIILASDYLRTQQTAEIINTKLNKAILPTKILREIKHPKEIIGKPHTDRHARSILEEIDNHADDANWHFSNEENFSDFRDRMERALASIAQRPEENIMAVTHSYAIRMITSILISSTSKLDWSFYKHLSKSMTASNTGITLAQHKKNKGWKLVTWNSVAHMSDLAGHDHHKDQPSLLV